jgi:uroporphyrinogen decarboxylase
MTSRERVLAAIDRKPVDRIPLDMVITYSAFYKLAKYMGWDHLKVESANIYGVTYTDPEMALKMNLDCIYVGLNPPSPTAPLRYGIDKEYTNEFGQIYRMVTQPNGTIEYEFINNPLKDFTLEDFENWELPNPENDAVFEGLEEHCRYIYNNTDLAIAANFGASLFNAPSFMRNMEVYFVDMGEEPEIIELITEKFLDYYTKMYNKALDIAGKYISFIRTDNDDFGTQQGPMISLSSFRTFFKPYFKQFYDSIKAKFAQVNPDGRLMKHSCGDNTIFLDDFIEIGVDLLDPLQPLAGKMSREFLSNYRGRISFHGGIDTQKVLPSGTPEDVYADVRDAIRHLASPTGYICASAHHILGDVPPQNIIALRDAVLEFGQVTDGRLVNLDPFL